MLLDIVPSVPALPVPDTPVGLTTACATTDSSPNVPTFALPVTPVTAAPAVIALPNVEVNVDCVTPTFASATTLSEPNAEVPANPVTLTVTEVTPHLSLPHVLLPHPVAIFYLYAILIIAFEASAAGNWIVKSPAVEVLSPPNANAATALFAVPAVFEEL